MNQDFPVKVINVSVVIAVKNEEIYIKSALESVISQTGIEHEIIVIDDDSNDNTFQIVKDISASYPIVKLHKNPRQGKSRAFNLGVSLAKGEFVCLFAGDDIMPPDSLSKRWNTIKDDKDAPWVVGLSKLRSMSACKKFDGAIVPKKKGLGGFTGTSYLMGREALNKIFPVPEILPNEDSWMMYVISMLPHIKIIHSDIISNYWRVHEGNSVNMMSSFEVYNAKMTPRLKAPFLFIEKFRKDLPNHTILKLEEEIKCENRRQNNDIIGILFSKLSLVEKLRVLSMTNRFFFFFRKNLFKFFSGW